MRIFSWFKNQILSTTKSVRLTEFETMNQDIEKKVVLWKHAGRAIKSLRTKISKKIHHKKCHLQASWNSTNHLMGNSDVFWFINHHDIIIHVGLHCDFFQSQISSASRLESTWLTSGRLVVELRSLKELGLVNRHRVNTWQLSCGQLYLPVSLIDRRS